MRLAAPVLVSLSLAMLAGLPLAGCGDSKEGAYTPKPPASGKAANLPSVPTLPQKPKKVGDSYTVWGAIHDLRSRVHSAKILDKEIDGSLRTLAPQANRAVGMFRPPFGAFGGAGNVRLKKLGLTDVRWSVDTLDWKAKNADKLRKKVLAMILKQHGGVVLMHDVKPITAKIIADVLDDLEAENCRRIAAREEPIVPVSLHYFLKDGKTARAIPEPVQQRTAAYRAALPTRCAARPPPPPAPIPPPAGPPIPPAVKPTPTVNPAQR